MLKTSYGELVGSFLLSGSLSLVHIYNILLFQKCWLFIVYCKFVLFCSKNHLPGEDVLIQIVISTGLRCYGIPKILIESIFFFQICSWIRLKYKYLFIINSMVYCDIIQNLIFHKIFYFLYILYQNWKIMWKSRSRICLWQLRLKFSMDQFYETTFCS